MKEEPFRAKTMPMARHEDDIHITPEMTLLDIISRHRETEAVFRKYDEQADVCLCCQALFDPLKTVAEKYGLDLKQILTDLASASSSKESGNHSRKEHDAHIAVDGKKGQVNPFKPSP